MRFEISEGGGEPLPPLDIVDDVVVIGSGPEAHVRLPADAARAAHIRIEGQSWTLLAESRIGGMVRAAGDSGSVGHGMVIELGNYRVRVSATPAERQLRGDPSAAPPGLSPAVPPEQAGHRAAFFALAALTVAALAALLWILAS